MVKRPPAQSRIERQRRRDYEARQALHARRLRRRRLDNVLAIAVAVVVAGAAIGAQLAYFGWGPGQPAPLPTPDASRAPTSQPGANVGAVPDPALAAERTWTGTMTINGIELGFELDGRAAPQATAVLVDAAERGWYIDTHCPRVTLYDTMQLIQCGSLLPDSTAAETDFRFGPIENAPADDLYPAGTIAMARVGDDAWSMGHQFFIVTSLSTIPADAAGGYSIVGQVTSGLGELIAEVILRGTADQSIDGPPAQPLTIETFTIG